MIDTMGGVEPVRKTPRYLERIPIIRDRLRCAVARRSARRGATSDALASVERRNAAGAGQDATPWGRGLLRRGFVKRLARRPGYALRPSPARDPKSLRRSNSVLSGYALAALLLIPLALGAGCSRSGPPAPVGGNAQSQAARYAAPASAGQTIVVAAGDTVHGLATRHNVTTRDLIAANALPPPYRLQVGQTLRVPSGRDHTVRGGETLYEISRRYGIDMHRLAHLNGLTPPYSLSHGQRLRLPGDGTSVAVASAPATFGRPLPVEASDRAAGNRGSANQGLGRVTVEPIQPPPASQTASQTASDPRPPARVETPPRPDGAGAPVAEAAVPRQAETATGAPGEPAMARGTAVDATAEPPVRTAGRFLWPVRGRVISEFGAKPGGLHNDGINIAVPRGEPVRAAENGVVVYAGSELKGFGNLLLVRHADGWITAYGHNDALLVGRGDAVNRGQVIARAGATGNVNTPQVHFELRRGTRAVDPRGYLGSQTAAAN